MVASGGGRERGSVKHKSPKSVAVCQGCGKPAEHGGGSVGAVCVATGYQPVMLQTGAVVYVCPDCWVTVQEGVAKLRLVFRDPDVLEYVHMPHITRTVREDKVPR